VVGAQVGGVERTANGVEAARGDNGRGWERLVEGDVPKATDGLLDDE